MLPGSKRPLLTLSAVLLTLSMTPAMWAQRPFQQRWLEWYQARPVPEIIEDDAPPLDPMEEEFLFPDPMSAFGSTTVFRRPERDPEPNPLQRIGQSIATGALALRDNNPALALRQFEQALATDPENVWLKLRAASAAVQANNGRRAEQLLQSVLRLEPENPQALQQFAELRLAQGRVEPARQLLEQLIEIQPQRIAALRLLTFIAYEVDRDFERTKELSTRILRIDDRHIEAIIWNAESLALTGDVLGAAAIYRRALVSRPNLITHLAEVARRLAAQGDLDGAGLLFETAILVQVDEAQFIPQWERILRIRGGDAAIDEGYRRLIREGDGDLALVDLYADFLRRRSRADDLLALRMETLEREPNHLNSLLDVATFHLDRNDFESAEPFLDRAASANPDDHEVFRRIGEAFLERNRLSQAREVLDKALILRPDDLATIELVAQLEETLGNRTKAIERLTKAVAEHPMNSSLRIRLGGMQLRGRDLMAAREHFMEATVLAPSEREPWVGLKSIAYEQEEEGELRLLEAQIRRVLQADSELQTQLGQLAEEFGDFERAIRYYRASLALSPMDFIARFSLARILAGLGRPAEADELIARGRPIDTAPAILHQIHDQFHARHLLLTRRFEEAEVIYRRLLADLPLDFQVLTGFHESLIRQGNVVESTRALNEFAQRHGNAFPTELQRLRANIFLFRDQPDRALTIFRRLAEEAGNSAESLFDLAIAASSAGRYDLAIETYRRLMALGPPEQNPIYETAANNLAYLFAVQGINLDEAEELGMRAMNLNPAAAHILDTVGWIFFRQGRYDEAREMLERAAARALFDDEIFTNLGQLYERIGELDLAQEMFERALEIAPNSRVAAERLDALRDRDNAQATP